ncbi:MAG: alcohol dehydrogenase catalytic domain-containing protein, partial [Thermodesulfobacteriota bacterium]|nr:alcohol dehydrogenase catalytic domain-containing protein [Thermodesulfobacteriota bacterium]
MRVAMYYNNRDIRVEEVPTPKIGPGELLVRVEASGICGSDVMEWYRIHKAPLVLGHEIAGEVVEVGEGVANYKVGDRVSASHHVPCNTCHYCLSGNHTACDTLRSTNFDPGGFAEFLRLPAINVDRGVYLLPDEVSFEEATFIEPLACVLRAQRRAQVEPGKTVLVLGSGIGGLLHIHLAGKLGATRVIATDIDDARLRAATRFGADLALNATEDIPNRLRKVNEGRLADCIIVCTGAVTALQQAMESVERGGTILFFAPTDKDATIPLSINDLFWRNDVTLTTSYAGDYADHMTALQLIQTKRVAVHEMITHKLGLAETVEGFKLVIEAHDSIKVIIEPQ